MLQKISLGVATMLCSLAMNAQETTEPPAPATTVTVSADAYYRMDFANKLENNKTSFTNSNNSFALGMASVKIDHSFGKVAATVDLGFGKRANEFSYTDEGALQAIKQAYVSYAPLSAIKFTAGKWATHIGYELLDAYANRNYSMSYGFSYGPFFHTGLKADISFGGKTGLMLGVANPTDYTYTTSQKKMFIAQLSTGTKDNAFKAYLNYQGGDSKSQFDLVLNAAINSKFGINYDGTIANIAGLSWNSNALYFNYDPTSKFGLALRGEYFDNTKGAALGDAWGNALNTSIFAATLSANFHIDNLTIIPEFRFDNAKDKIFFDKSGNATGSAGSFLIAAVYKF